jgi:hypothetical protein
LCYSFSVIMEILELGAYSHVFTFKFFVWTYMS